MLIGAGLIFAQVLTASPLSEVAATAMVETATLTGQWMGAMTLGTREYPIQVWFDATSPVTGRIQLVGLSSDRNPLTDVTIHGDTVSFQLASRPPQVFKGELQGHHMQGSIRIGEMVESFTLQKIPN